jgi:predicted lipoprotein with Yx(FWY)xxD motif
MIKKSLISFLVVAVVLVLATSGSFAQSDYSVMTAENPGYGSYLVDGQGMSLYYFTKDAPGKSSCNGEPCSSMWPVFYTEKLMVSTDLDPTDFGVIIRADGKMQTTFRGYPLYYFVKDMVAGDMKGQNFKNVWFVIYTK